MKRTFSRASRLLVPWLLALGLACQGTSPTATPAELVTAPPVPSPTAALRPTPAGAGSSTPASPTGLAGQVLSASDVAGQPDVPLPEQMVLAVAAAAAEEVLGPGTAALAETELRFLKASLPAPHAELAATLTDQAGNYALALPPGSYLLCLADSEAIPPAFPARTRGCGRVEVAAGSISRVDISSGFGEILLSAP